MHGGMWTSQYKGNVPSLYYIKLYKKFPQHLSEIMCLSDSIRECFEKGGFVCNIRGTCTKMHVVALNEAHEMLENKDIKNSSVVRPSAEYLNTGTFATTKGTFNIVSAESKTT